LTFHRTIAIDDQYMFTVTDRVTNTKDKIVALSAYGQINRLETPPLGGYMILHEGPIGVLNGKLTEPTYANTIEKKALEETTMGGWLGLTDKYWLVALIPDQKTSVKTVFKGQTVNGQDRYQTDVVMPMLEAKPGQPVETVHYLFAGAKILRLLDDYEAKLGFDKFDLAIDFGWFYFLTKPLFYVLDYLHKLLGNFGLAILALTVLFKVAFFPLANKSYRSMSHMKKMQPKIEALKERYGDDKLRMNQELMAMYKKEKINPLAGCLPMVIQAPVFFCLYKVLFVTLEMRHAPFYGWIQDLSAPDPTSILNLFGLLPWSTPSFLAIGAWPILMGLTMFLQQKLNPQPTDPMQARMFMLMPIFLTFLLASFPAGLVIYWAWNNILSMGQQWMIMRLEDKR
jgi:YidC/Oxa1 family membrane protein insertase